MQLSTKAQQQIPHSTQNTKKGSIFTTLSKLTGLSWFKFRGTSPEGVFGDSKIYPTYCIKMLAHYLKINLPHVFAFV